MTRRRFPSGMAAALLSAALLTAVPVAQQKPPTQKTPQTPVATSPDALLGEALHEEEVEGRLQNAIAIYQKVLKAPGVTRAQAGRAQFRIGACYERLGLAEARKAFEAVVAGYADQDGLAAEAKGRLLALARSPGMQQPAGLTLRKVWAGDLEDTRVSPDGNYLTVITPDTGVVMVQDLATGATRQVTHEGDPSRQVAAETAVSRDGKQIAYVVEDQTSGSYELRVTGFDGSHGRTLYVKKSGYIDLHDWSPDSKQLLVLLSEEEGGSIIPAQVVWVAVADGSMRIVKTLPRRTQIPSSFRFPNLSVSPDGRWIVYSMLPGEDSQERDLFLMSADGSRDAPLIRHPADDRDPVWTPDGTRILFVSDRAGTTGIWSMAMADGKAAGPQEMLRSNVGQVGWKSLTVARNGACYYVLNAGMEDIHVADIDPDTGSIVAPPTQGTARLAGFAKAPSWSPDGQYLAYFARNGRLRNPDGDGGRLVIRSIRSGEEREVGAKIFQMADAARWFADGRSVLLTGWTGERLNWLDPTNVRQVFYRLDVQSGESRVLREFAPRTVDPPDPTADSKTLFNWHAPRLVGPAELSPDGKTLFYWQREEQKTVRLVAWDMETGAEKVLRREPAWDWLDRPAISPDGRHLAVLVPDATAKSTAISLMSVNGSDARELLRFPSSADEGGVTWSPDGRHVYFVRGSGKDGRTELWRVPAQGGEPLRIGLENADINSPAFHPDGRRLAFDARPAKWTPLELWEMKNYLPGTNTAR